MVVHHSLSSVFAALATLLSGCYNQHEVEVKNISPGELKIAIVTRDWSRHLVLAPMSSQRIEVSVLKDTSLTLDVTSERGTYVVEAGYYDPTVSKSTCWNLSHDGGSPCGDKAR